MSFGFGIGDIITVAGLAKSIRKDFLDAPDAFKSITDEVRNVSNVLQDLEVNFDRITEDQETTIQTSVKECKKVLDKLATIRDKNSDLGAPAVIPNIAGQQETSRKRVTRNVKTAWKRFRWDTSEITSLREQLTQCISALNTGIAVDTRQAAYVIKDGVESLNRHHDDEAREKLLEWLTPINYGSEQSDFISRRQNGTAEWFLNSIEFKDWLRDTNRTLFCPGIPGAGKTILTSVVIDELTTRCRGDSKVGIAFLYCNFRRTREQTITDLTASLLKQLVNGLSSVPSSVLSLHDKHSKRNTRPSLHELATHLAEVASMYRKVFVIVDALDECQTTNACRTELIEVIFDLQAKCGANIFATARFIPDITERFNTCTTLEIRASKYDVIKFLDEKIPKRPASSDWNDSIKVLIKDTISKVVDGMFLLAELYLQSLDDKITPRAVRIALNDLQRPDPKSSNIQNKSVLDLAYDDAMERIKKQLSGFQELAIKVLFWITFSEVPLKAEDLQYALAIKHGDTYLDEENIISVERMLSVCAGLVTTDPESNVIRLVHYTTQEYLGRTCDKWFDFDPHTKMVEACVTFLSFSTPPGSDPRELDSELGSMPFFRYASLNWGHHARKATDLCPALIDFLQNNGAMVRACRAMGNEYHFHRRPVFEHGAGDDSSTQLMATHMTAFYGVERAVQFLLCSGADSNSKDMAGRTPLMWAAFNGHETVAKLIVDFYDKNNGVANISLQISNSSNMDRNTPLSYAAGEGHEAIVKLLLTRDDVMLDSRDEDGRTPLSYAAAEGHEAIVKLLLTRDDVMPDTRDEDGRTPLSYAAPEGHEAIVKLLLTRDDVMPDSRDEYGRTPLLHAAAEGHEAIVKLLLTRDDVMLDSRDEDGMTPLSYAAHEGHEAIVKLLLTRDDVMPDSRDEYGRTPLLHAAAEGHEAIVKLLLTRDDVMPDTRDEDGRTPLSYAAHEGHEAIVKLLLTRDDVMLDSRDEDGRTPLLYAADEGHEAIVKLLLTRDDVMPDSRDEYGRTPLLHAAADGHEAIVKLLLARDDVMPDTRDEDGRTPLSHAAEKGQDTTVGQLLACGDVVPDSIDEDGMTPLSYATREWHVTVARQLIGTQRVDLNKMDHEGLTPLLYAIGKQAVDVVEVLLDVGKADACQPDLRGMMPLESAALLGAHDIVILLLKRDDVRSSLKSGCGQRAIDSALEGGFVHVSELIREAMAA